LAVGRRCKQLVLLLVGDHEEIAMMRLMGAADRLDGGLVRRRVEGEICVALLSKRGMVVVAWLCLGEMAGEDLVQILRPATVT
jgi:hypothetical protein